MAGANIERRALVKRFGLDVENGATAVGGDAAGLFDEKGHGISLVVEAQLALGIVAARGIHINAALEQIAVEIGHQRTDVARGIGPLGGRVVGLTIFNVALHAVGEAQILALIDRIDGAIGGNLHVLVGEAEDAQRGVIGEAIDAVAGAVNQHGGRAVDDVAGSHLPAAGLEKISQGYRRAHRRHPPIDGKNRAHGHIHINIGRAVQRVGENHIFGVEIFRVGEGGEVFLLLGGEAGHIVAGLEGIFKGLVGEDVQLLLGLALHIVAAEIAENVLHQAGLVDVAVEDFRRQAQG